MKIAKIEIEEFRQFKNLTLNLTYPKGHDKEGEPLDKVCIIGQSGTGKTNLLDLIYGRNLVTHENNYFEQFIKSKFKFINRDGVTDVFDFGKEFSSSLSGMRPEIYFFNIQLKSPLRTIHNDGKNHQFIRNHTSEKLWTEKMEDYKEHANERSKYVFAVSNAFGKKSQEEVNQLVLEKENWERDNPNPLEEIAELLDPIIDKFGLKTRLEITSLDQLGFINLVDKVDNDIPQDWWSTGTNQIIYKTYPLYALKPQNSIILIDEPENSLYPDIQTEIIEHYTRLAPTSQFFFATHSPIIASCFEPWEIVELKFDENGEVYRDKYYEGENHIDNYKLDPRYLRWDSILKKIFDLDVEGNEEERIPKLMELATLKSEIKEMKSNGANNGELEAKYEEIKKLANLLAVPVKL